MLRTAATDEAAVARITGDEALTVLDSEGFAVQEQTFSTDAAGIGEAVALAERVAKAERLRALDRGDAELVGQVHVELRAHGGGAMAMTSGPWLPAASASTAASTSACR